MHDPMCKTPCWSIRRSVGLCHLIFLRILLYQGLQRLTSDQQRASGVAVCGIVQLFYPLLIQLREFMRLKCTTVSAVLINGGIRSDRKQYA